MATRLDRLLILLESGSTPVARKAAADQIGEIQKLHPHELNNLLRKVSKYLKHKSWDTRIAAAQAVEAIAKNVRKWSPSTPTPSPSPRSTSPSITVQHPLNEDPQTAAVKMEGVVADSINDIELMSFEKFDITQVLCHGIPLLSSTGEEFTQLDTDPDYQRMSFQEKAMFHRQQLKEKLGLVAQGKVFSTGLEQLFDDDDLVCNNPVRTPLAPKSSLKQENDIVQLSSLSGMSARERNRAKRKAKMASRKNNRNKEENNDSDNTNQPPLKKAPQTSSVVVEQSGDSDKVLIDQVMDPDMIFDDINEWPFTWFCEEMFCQLFNPQWEFRHGAASALREIIRLHGDTAGITASAPPHERQSKNQCWLVDVAIRLLCVFALDRFADFVSDQVVAPVRATCAQVLGIVCRQLESNKVGGVIDTLLILVQQDMWEVRHAALMGIQHLLASRMDLSQSLLPVVADSILKGLQDSDDDVRAVAAGSLLPVADKLYMILQDKVPSLLTILWDSLLKLDDLSASTSAVMDLLSNLFISLQKHTDVSQVLLPDHLLATYIPRTYPFLSHNISSVRLSSLSAIKNLLSSKSRCNSDGQTGLWIPQFLDGLVCQLFQRLALEGEDSIRNLCLEVWSLVVDGASVDILSSLLFAHLMQWLNVLSTSCHMSVDPAVLVGALQAKELRDGSHAVFLGGTLGVESMNIKDQSAFAARVASTRALGMLANKVFSQSDSSHVPPPDSTPSPTPSDYFLDSIRQMSKSNNATYKIIASLIVTYWKEKSIATDIVETLTGSLSEQILYEELAPFLLSLQKECHILISAFDKKGKDVTGGVSPSGYTADFALKLASTVYNDSLHSLTLTEHEKQEFDTYHRNLLTTLGQLQEQHQALQGRVQCCCAGSLIMVSALPKKLTPIIKPLMDSLKTQSDSLMQSLSAEWLSKLLDLSRDRTPCPNTKILKNLCGYLCCDVNHTPSVQLTEVKSSIDEGVTLSPTSGIISLIKHMRKTSSLTRRKGRGRPSAAMKEAMIEAANLSSNSNGVSCVVQRVGGEIAISSMTKHYGDQLFTALPQLWLEISEPLTKFTDKTLDESSAQSLINALQVLEVLTAAVHHDLKEKMLTLLPNVLKYVICSFTAVRHMAARCLASYAKLDLHESIKFLLDEVLPFLGDTVHESRQGSIETISCLLDNVGMSALCYIVFLIMPVLGKMSDQQRDVRLMASQCFATLVTLMPLESGAESPPDMLPELASRRVSERKFLEQLLDSKKLEPYKVAVPINADLRKYQQDGINWLAFLNQYNLHGILCDDMGLGKTLQSICIVASDHVERQKNFEATGQADCAPLPSIVVCPPTLTGHWAFEVKKFCSEEHLNALQYHGPPATRVKLQKSVPNYNLIIVSYDVIRNDIDFFKKIHWNYCILDEGHIIKNTRTKITKAVKSVKANHRLILSGTPIQNNVLELWSLFDFLMPGFLGTERQFNERFGRPILLSRDAKSSSKEQEAGALAMENLHRQVLPFLLRRMKEDVLQDLPPKIIQDYHCDLSPLQVQLYEDFARSQAQKQVEDEVKEEDMETDKVTPTEAKEKKGGSHIFQALQYLRKVCNHPALVVTPSHPMYSKVMDYLKKDKTSLHNISHSAKLLALKQLLNECGIGIDDTTDSDDIGIGLGGGAVGGGAGSVVSQHRVLLFCQYKSILNIIEKDLLKVHMPSVTYLRLDGSVPANSRHDLVQRFNLDPSIDLLLLTTHVGGLGLNLTGADTVIFFEHDWNPMKDLQAMDRAHRIGQKRVVNVYRLITRGTLEEKIMSLQKFKLNIANTVITQENSSLLSMNTSDILDLFQLGGEGSGGGGDTSTRGRSSNPLSSDKGQLSTAGGSSSLKSILEGVPDLWDDDQYGGEYDMNKFMKSLAEK